MGGTLGQSRDWENLCRVLMENVKDFAIFSLDEAGRIRSWNIGAARILGFEDQDVIGQSFSLIFTPEDRGNGQPEFELRTARERGRAEDERWHLRKDGTRFWASGVLVADRDDAGTLCGFVKILRDITERKRLEESLIEANQRKDEFLAMLSHELRNPLSAIANATALIRTESALDSSIERTTRVIERQVFHLTGLVDDLLDISRIRSGKIQLHPVPFELSEVLRHAAESLHSTFMRKEQHFELVLPDEPLPIEADPTRIEQIVTNLLMNAGKFTHERGHIRLTSLRQADGAVITVEDDGMGILSEMLPRIFQPFVQVDRSLDRAQGGLGLGLALVRKLTEMHGGKVEAFSEGIGKGSRFVVRLPCGTEAGAVSGAKPTLLGIPPSRVLRILIAEDNRDVASVLSQLLIRLGHRVRIAHTGPDVTRMALEEHPDVVLMDIGLPGMDGLQVASLLRGHTELRGCRLIAMTGYGSDEDRRRSREAGFDAHLVKPVDFSSLREQLAEAESR